MDTAIFAYLLERAQSLPVPTERHAYILRFAHYTPTAYVERLVIPTIIEPLRQQWKQVQELAFEHVDAGNHESAIKEIHNYHKELSEVTVLDPTFYNWGGSGVFLAVSFPLLEITETQKQKIRDIAEKLDAQRKEMQKNYPKLTLTALYNMLEAARNETALTRKEQKLFETLEQKEIATLLTLPNKFDAGELDAAVAEIYGLDVNATESILKDF